MRHEVQHHDNPDYITLHVTHPMFSWHNFISKDCKPHEKNLVEALQNVAGVREVSVSKYRLTIERGRCYDWDDIVPNVMGILSAWESAQKAVRVTSGL